MTSPSLPLPRRAAAVAATAAVVALSVVGAVVPSGASPSTAASAGAGPSRSAFPTRPTRVLVVGDSVIEGTASRLPGALDGREVTMDTEVSRSTSATAASAATHGTDWDVVLIQVGHNDGGSPGAYQPPYRQMLDRFAGVPRIVVLTLHEARPYYADVNAFLRGEASARANVRVADWNAVNQANPGATGGDGLHLTGTGASLMTDLVVGAVEQAEADFAAPPTTLPPPTTAPPTTPPPATTTTATTVLIPPASVVQDPPTTTSTSSPPEPVASPTAPTDTTDTTDTTDEDDGGGPAPAATGPVLIGATAALGAVLTRWAKRLPR